MKISISYPPLVSAKGVPLLSQNRQFQWFSEPTYIYPVVPAYAATLLWEAGYDVVWDDGIAEEKSYPRWLSDLERAAPDVVVMETKTPVVKRHWAIIGDVKAALPDAKVVLVGDHVTALPLESMEQSKVDFVLTGGDYDFLLLNLVEFLDGKAALEPGVWYREGGKVKNTGAFKLNHSLDDLPFINRDLTKWWLYSERNGNFKVTPGAYTMAGRDCWWRKDGGCTFCSWPTLYPTFRAVQPERLVDEVGLLIEKYGVKSVFDDTGCFPAGEWLRRFCRLLIERGYNRKVQFSCNMRFGALSRRDYQLMKRAGFRMLLFGVESGSQATLDRLNKGTKIEEIINECKISREEGLEPHITIMVGYPWESREEAKSTLNVAKMLMQKGWATTLQSTIVVPYPGSKLYAEALRNGWFRVAPKDYERFDMKEPVMNTPDMTSEEVMSLCDEVYKVFLTPRYMLKQLTRIRTLRDVKYSIKGVAKVSGHIKDFRKMCCTNEQRTDKKNVAIIGAGIFGAVAAIKLSEKGFNVTIFEKNNDILLNASYINQNRVHMGYHYPRSDETVSSSLQSQGSFFAMFGDVVVSNLHHFYCIAKEGTLTNSTQYLNFCKRHKLPYTIEFPTSLTMSRQMVDLCIRVPEKLYDANLLREKLRNMLKTNNITLLLSSEVIDIKKLVKGYTVYYKSKQHIHKKKFDAVVNATYSNINYILKMVGLATREYQYELCELPVVKVPWKERTGFAIMDGPFFGILPFGNSDEYTIWDVDLSVLERSIGELPKFKFDIAYYDNEYSRRERFKKFSDKISQYIEGFKAAEYLYSFYIVKIVLKDRDYDDSRPTEVINHGDGFLSVFSGKVSVSVTAAETIVNELTQFFNYSK